jgi:cyclase
MASILRLSLATAICLATTARLSAQQPTQAPTVQTLHVQKSVHMMVGPAGNTLVQVGEDGPLVVDTQPADAAPALRAAIRVLSPKPIHTIIDTHVLNDRPEGDDALIKLRGTGASQQVHVVAHEAVLDRLVNGPGTGTKPVGGLALNQVISLPINSTYTSPGRDFYLNGESVVLYHAPKAHSDGDTIVHFRGSDVLAVGSLFEPDRYPVIDIVRGGSVNGLIAALNRILELTVPARFQEGGTYVVPARGRLSDEADVVEYRDMVTIVRDRVAALIGRGMTLAQVKAARPSSDYDPEFGGTGTSSPDAFVESIHRSLGGK